MPNLRFLFIHLVAVAIPAFAAEKDCSSYSGRYAKELHQRFYPAQDLAEAPINAMDVIKLVQGKNPLGRPLRTKEELLSLLPKGLMRRPVLVYESRSRLGASKKEPRVILQSPQGDFFLSFTGHSKGKELIEIMDVSSEKPAVLRSISFSNGAPQVSSENPQECRQCHGNSPQPIFNTYHLWPGVYGSNDDEIVLGSDEATHFQIFLDTYKNHPAYKYLLIGVEEMEDARSKTKQLFPSQKEEKYGLPGRPSLLLSTNIEASLDGQFFRKIINHPKLRAYLYVLAAADFCSRTKGLENPEDYIPPDARKGFSPYSEVLKEIESKREAHFQNIVEKTSKLAGVSKEKLRDATDSYSKDDTAILAWLQYLAKNVLGESISGYDSVRGRNSFAFSSGLTGPSRFSAMASCLVNEFDSELSKRNLEDRCKYAREQSWAQLSKHAGLNPGTEGVPRNKSGATSGTHQ